MNAGKMPLHCGERTNEYAVNFNHRLDTKAPKGYNLFVELYRNGVQYEKSFKNNCSIATCRSPGWLQHLVFIRI